MGTTGQSESDLMREEDIEIDIPDEGETSEEYEEDEEDCEYDDDEEEEEEEEDNDRSYTVEELFKYKTHPDCQEEPENLIHSTLPILKKNAAKNVCFFKLFFVTIMCLMVFSFFFFFLASERKQKIKSKKK